MTLNPRFVFSVTCVVVAFHGAVAVAAEADRPNILFIIADDQSPFDFKFYNPASKLDSPVIDRLAAEGIVLDGAYHMGAWAGGVCTPSRHMIMSGRTVCHIPDKPKFKDRNPHLSNPRLVPPDLADYTMAAVFNRAGYDTMRTCKNGNSYEAANARFSVSRTASKTGDTDETGSAWHAQQVFGSAVTKERFATRSDANSLAARTSTSRSVGC